jgi:hypothetical protein
MSRILLMWLISCCLFTVVGFLFAVVEHTGPHDWYRLPGITIEHYRGRGLRLESIDPLMLLPALAVSYGITWSLFWLASLLYGRRQPQ